MNMYWYVNKFWVTLKGLQWLIVRRKFKLNTENFLLNICVEFLMCLLGSIYRLFQQPYFISVFCILETLNLLSVDRDRDFSVEWSSWNVKFVHTSIQIHIEKTTSSLCQFEKQKQRFCGILHRGFDGCQVPHSKHCFWTCHIFVWVSTCHQFFFIGGGLMSSPKLWLVRELDFPSVAQSQLSRLWLCIASEYEGESLSFFAAWATSFSKKVGTFQVQEGWGVLDWWGGGEIVGVMVGSGGFGCIICIPLAQWCLQRLCGL